MELERILLICINVSSFLANLWVFSSVIINKKLRCSVAYYVAAVSAVYLIMSCFDMPIYMIYKFNYEWKFGEYLCNVWLVSREFTGKVDVLFFIVLSLVIIRATNKKNHLQQIQTGAGGLKTIGMIWITVIVIYGIVYFLWNENSAANRKCESSQLAKSFNNVVFAVLFVALIVVQIVISCQFDINFDDENVDSECPQRSQAVYKDLSVEFITESRNVDEFERQTIKSIRLAMFLLTLVKVLVNGNYALATYLDVDLGHIFLMSVSYANSLICVFVPLIFIIFISEFQFFVRKIKS